MLQDEPNPDSVKIFIYSGNYLGEESLTFYQTNTSDKIWIPTLAKLTFKVSFPKSQALSVKDCSQEHILMKDNVIKIIEGLWVVD